MSWDEGYISQIGYTHGCYREMNPLMLDLALIANGVKPLSKRPLRYLELGFGQGLSLNIHAAACEGEFWGNDFIPAHVANAKELAQVSGASVNIVDDSFAELAARDDLPEFDIIALHGVWSWISAENRQIVLDIIRSKLALGGLVYISYNTTPGWSMTVPVRELMMQHFHDASPSGSNVTTKIDHAIKFVQQLIDADAAYFNNAPSALTYFNHIKNERRDYLAHELFNADWSPMPFSEIAAQLSAVNLTFVGHAAAHNIFSGSILPLGVKNFLADIDDTILYESVHDYCINQQFRKDIWIKGGSALSTLQQLQLLGDMRFTLLFNPLDAPLAVPCNTGIIPVDEKIARPIITALAKNDFAPQTINDLLKLPELCHLNLTQAREIILTLCGRYIAPAHDEETITQLKSKTDKLNSFLISKSRYCEDSMYLVSPVIGGGLPVSRIHQLFLLALRHDFTSQESAVSFVWKELSTQGHCLAAPEGNLLSGDHDNLEELARLAESFFTAHLPMLTALKVT